MQKEDYLEKTRRMLKNLEPKLEQLLIPESMNVLLSFSVYLLLLFLEVYGVNTRVYSIEHEGKTVVVLYHGLCLVSAEDRLLIRGKWYKGKKLGIQGNVVVADRIENLSSGILFSKE